MTQTIVYILICINVVTFVVYGIDKWKAKHSKMRIREAALLMLAAESLKTRSVPSSTVL